MGFCAVWVYEIPSDMGLSWFPAFPHESQLWCFSCKEHHLNVVPLGGSPMKTKRQNELSRSGKRKERENMLGINFNKNTAGQRLDSDGSVGLGVSVRGLYFSIPKWQFQLYDNFMTAMMMSSFLTKIFEKIKLYSSPLHKELMPM